ncbi:hypothetical protein B0H14DRAFT_3450490 [Mycena olivaceomarginata]|nr:hypothetical protein B0H14DRAFT_3476387 [Mycena olivaceomarginata]KAJ7852890.1 hypothetical protein B0H14DRAFT_3450490 [Mycena olivaceomarginata]
MLNFTLPSDPAVRLELVAGGFQIIDMLREVEEELPPFRAVFSPHGNPNLVPDHELRDMAQEAANKGTCAFQFHSSTPSLPASSLQHPWLFQPFTSSLSLTTTLRFISLPLYEWGPAPSMIETAALALFGPC